MTVPHIAYWFGPTTPPDESRSSGPTGRGRSTADSVPSEFVEPRSVDDETDLALVRQIGVGRDPTSGVTSDAVRASASEAAFRVLHDRVYASLWSFARACADSRDGADDLAQEALMLLWHRAPQWDERSHVRGFLFATVRNLSRNLTRRRQTEARSEQVHQDDIVRLAMATIPGTPEERLEHHELITAVARAVAELPDTRRIALLLRWRDHLPYEEIGRVLGISSAAAHHLVTRARAAVRLRIAPLLEI